MKSREALRLLAAVSESQWGMVTSAQAVGLGVSHMNLARLADAGDLVRLSHGVYRDAGAPSGEHEELRAAWLAIDPATLAHQRLRERPRGAVVSGESASRLLGLGDMRAMRSEFTTPARKQTQRPDVRYRTRALSPRDVTVRDGLPVTTPERTIADLVEDRQDLSVIGGVLRDALRRSRPDLQRLSELLGPLAERNGHPRGAGEALLDDLLRSAGSDLDSLAVRAAAIPGFGAQITAQNLDTAPGADSRAIAAALDVVAIATVVGDRHHRLELAATQGRSEREDSES